MGPRSAMGSAKHHANYMTFAMMALTNCAIDFTLAMLALANHVRSLLVTSAMLPLAACVIYVVSLMLAFANLVRCLL